MTVGPIISVTVDVSQLVLLAKEIPAAVEHINFEMSHAMKESGMLLTTMVAARTPVNLGLLRASIVWPYGFEQHRGDAIDSLVGAVGASDIVSPFGVSTSEYVIYVEEGTVPHWAPIAPLQLWTLRKWGDDASAAYVLQAHIAKHGTKGKHMFKNAWEGGGKARVVKLFQAVPPRAMARMRRSWGLR